MSVQKRVYVGHLCKVTKLPTNAHPWYHLECVSECCSPPKYFYPAEHEVGYPIEEYQKDG